MARDAAANKAIIVLRSITFLSSVRITPEGHDSFTAIPFQESGRYLDICQTTPAHFCATAREHGQRNMQLVWWTI
jgi:hypothetical protein